MKKRIISKSVLVVIMGFFLSSFVSCATVGREFAEDRVDQIRIGQSSSDDIRQMFGNPWRTGMDDGEKTWTYVHYKYKALKGAQVRSDLVVRFDEKGVVSSYTYNTADGTK